MSADWSRLREHLAKSGDRVTLTWDEFDQLVGGLPASAVNHRAWWSGDRPHTRAWTELGYRVEAFRPGVKVTWVRAVRPSELQVASSERRGSVAMPAAESVIEPGQSTDWTQKTAQSPDVLLVTCVKEKGSAPAPARELYTSPLFRKQRAYAERVGVPWFILSAEHGLVAPDEWLAPYDRYLPDTSATFRAAWGPWVVERLALLHGDLRGLTVEVHASTEYVRAIRTLLAAKGARVTEPLAGLAFGPRLAWYGNPENAQPTEELDRASMTTVVEMLTDAERTVSPGELVSTGSADLRVPGLYSWWVDVEGAHDLSDGLGHRVPEGLIYAGLAGATRWPSGKRSTNTLWLRLVGMHLGKKEKFSTFRRTLFASLRSAPGHEAMDEPGLTAWMNEHLKVIAIPYLDADALGKLEEEVLAEIDPPLNLKGMQSTPLRMRLKELRRKRS